MIKAQVLIDFILECTIPKEKEVEAWLKEEKPKSWILYVDGSSSSVGCITGLVLTNQGGVVIEYAKFRFQTSNSEIEYEDLITGLKIVKELEVKQPQ